MPYRYQGIGNSSTFTLMQKFWVGTALCVAVCVYFAAVFTFLE
jgi:hypothetical protein